jgi:tRNA-binding EMAP/Myf-like protein
LEAATQPTTVLTEEFSKTDFRVARIANAEQVEGADRPLSPSARRAR